MEKTGSTVKEQLEYIAAAAYLMKARAETEKAIETARETGIHIDEPGTRLKITEFAQYVTEASQMIATGTTPFPQNKCDMAQTDNMPEKILWCMSFLWKYDIACTKEGIDLDYAPFGQHLKNAGISLLEFLAIALKLNGRGRAVITGIACIDGRIPEGFVGTYRTPFRHAVSAIMESWFPVPYAKECAGTDSSTGEKGEP